MLYKKSYLNLSFIIIIIISIIYNISFILNTNLKSKSIFVNYFNFKILSFNYNTSSFSIYFNLLIYKNNINLKSNSNLVNYINLLKPLYNNFV